MLCKIANIGEFGWKRVELDLQKGEFRMPNGDQKGEFLLPMGEFELQNEELDVYLCFKWFNLTRQNYCIVNLVC